jgi:hypothetical protein
VPIPGSGRLSVRVGGTASALAIMKRARIEAQGQMSQEGCGFLSGGPEIMCESTEAQAHGIQAARVRKTGETWDARL